MQRNAAEGASPDGDGHRTCVLYRHGSGEKVGPTDSRVAGMAMVG